MSAPRWTTHARVWAFALATSLVVCLPVLLMPIQRRFYQKHFPDDFSHWTHNGRFSLIDSYYLAEDEYPYAARIHESAAHVLPGDPYIKENKSLRLISRDLITFAVLGRLSRLFGGIPASWAAFRLIGTLLWVPCLFVLLRRMDVDEGPALFWAAVSTVFADFARLIVGHDPAALARALVEYSFWPLGSYQYWFGPARLTRPLFTQPWLFLAGPVFVWASSPARRSIGPAILSGVLGGLLIYVHPDVWAAYAAASGLFFLFSLRRGEAGEGAISLAVSAAVSAPWLFLNGTLPDTGDVIARAATHLPELASFFYLLAVWLSRRTLSNPTALWCACLLVGLFAALNAQVLTGSATNGSLWFYLGNAFAVLLLGAAASDALRWPRERWLWLTACALLLAVPRGMSYSVLHYRIQALPKDQEEALSWLDAKTAPDSVVACLSPMTTLQIPVHTRDKTFVSMVYPLTSDLAVEQNASRLRAALELFGVDQDRFVRFGMDDSGRWAERLWLGEIDDLSRDRSGSIVRYFGVMDEARFRGLLASGAPSSVKDAALDYAWVGPFEKALGVRIADGWTKVYENPSVTIYRVRSGS